MTAAFFKVSGEYLTDLARQRCIEDRWDHGFSLLHEGLQGISMEQVLTILRGDAKLVGTNALDLFTEDNKEWKATLDWHHCGVWVTGDGRFFRPYAIVTSWGREDMTHANKLSTFSDSIRRSTSTFSQHPEEMGGRDLFYADDPRNDVRKSLRIPKDMYPDVPRTRGGTVSVLFKEVHNHPVLLVPAINDAQRALDDYLRRHELEERGHAIEFAYLNSRDEAPATSPLDDYASFETVEESAFGKRVAAMNAMLEAQRTTEESLPGWYKAIKEQAGDNWIERPYKSSTIYLPLAPLENWALWRTDGAHLALPWQTVCPRGVKMFGDDPYHTDIIVGAGLDPVNDYDDAELKALLFEEQDRIQAEKMGFSCTLLTGGGIATGKVVCPGDEVTEADIFVIPTASPDYLMDALKAKAVITGEGGRMAHLVNVARGREKLIVRVADAPRLYPRGASVTVDATEGRVTLHEGTMKVNF